MLNGAEIGSNDTWESDYDNDDGWRKRYLS